MPAAKISEIEMRLSVRHAASISTATAPTTKPIQSGRRMKAAPTVAPSAKLTTLGRDRRSSFIGSPRRDQHWWIAVDHPPGGSHADPPGVSAQMTGMPEFDVAVAPGAPQGMPTAGRVSRPGGGVGVVVGVGECALVVCASVVCGAEDEVTGGAVVAADDGVTHGGVVVTGAGAVTTGGGGMAVAGAGRAGGTVVTGDGVSTSGGAS